MTSQIVSSAKYCPGQILETAQFQAGKMGRKTLPPADAENEFTWVDIIPSELIVF